MASCGCVLREEGGGGVDETHDPFVGDESLFKKREVELQKRMTRRDGSTMSLAQSKRASEVQKDINAWEENRLFTSGVVRAREVPRCLLSLPDPHTSLLLQKTKIY
jgi:pre-mRNA-splicing factor ATP-dependent RNA helicase DHX38/PRP16